MLITHIHIVTNGGDTKAYVRAEDAIESLETAGGEWSVLFTNYLAEYPRRLPIPVIPGNRDNLLSKLMSEGYLDFAGNTGTRINRVKLNSGTMQAVLIPEGADIEEH